MTILSLLSVLVTAAALFGWLSDRVLRVPQTIGSMGLTVCFSVLLIFVSGVFPAVHGWAVGVAGQADLRVLILHGGLGLLLFAGAFLLDLAALRAQKLAVAMMAIFATLISTAGVAAFMFFALPLLHVHASWVECMLFGALISPTDPIAVLEMLGRVGVSKQVEAQLAGESLFNDGVGVVIFALLLGVLVITVEFRHKTVTTAFLVTPRRPLFVAGKLLIAVLSGAALALVVLAGTVIGGGIALSAKGGSFGTLAGQIGAVLPGMVLVYALFAVVGVGVGSLLTNQVVAIVVCLGWFLILENIIAGIWTGTVRWLPGGVAQAAANVSGGGNRDIGLFSWWQGSLLILLYGLAFAALGSIVLTRRDIT